MARGLQIRGPTTLVRTRKACRGERCRRHKRHRASPAAAEPVRRGPARRPVRRVCRPARRAGDLDASAPRAESGPGAVRGRAGRLEPRPVQCRCPSSRYRPAEGEQRQGHQQWQGRERQRRRRRRQFGEQRQRGRSDGRSQHRDSTAAVQFGCGRRRSEPDRFKRFTSRIARSHSAGK
jgi:hypothetical protein